LVPPFSSLPMDIHSYLNRLKDRYEERVSMKYDGTRRREMVELKAALVNALQSVVHTVDIATLFGCDRSTVINTTKQHSVYLQSSSMYRWQYYVALELINESLMQLPPGIRFGRQGRGDIVQQVKQINQTITFLNELKDVIRKNGKHNQIYLSGN
jgi:hypothetical protein